MAELIGMSQPAFSSFLRKPGNQHAQTKFKLQDFIEKNRIEPLRLVTASPIATDLGEFSENIPKTEDEALRGMGIVPYKKRDLTDKEKRCLIHGMYETYGADTKWVEDILDIILL